MSYYWKEALEEGRDALNGDLGLTRKQKLAMLAYAHDYVLKGCYIPKNLAENHNVSIRPLLDKVYRQEK